MRQPSAGPRSGFEPSPFSQGSSRIFCWGNTTNGELGLGGIEENHILVPREVHLKLSPSSSVLDISCGDSHSLLVTNRGEVLSCGNNDYGQIGRELSQTQIEPKSSNNCQDIEHCETQNAPSLTRFVLVESLSAHFISKVACGANHSVAINEWGQLFSWGSDAHGQLGVNGGKGLQTVPKTVKHLATSTIVQVACGENHTLALTYDGQLFSWGSNSFGQLGLGTSTDREVKPTLVASLAGIPLAFIACGGNHSFAVSKSGAVFGWGKNAFGQLGLSDEGNKKFPSQLKTLRSIRVKYIACGDDFSVFLTSDGGVFTCGAGMYGQLGHGSLNNETLPRKVLELMGSTVTQIACGRRHTLALVPSRGRVYSFGLGAAGQLGAKTSGNSSTPQVVQGPWLNEGPSDTIANSNSLSKECVVKRICAGGDHCFGLVTSHAGNIPADDFRVFAQDSQILTFMQEEITRCESLSVNEQVDLDILGYLETVFSSQACLNGSFLQKDDEHYCCTSRHHGVDVPEAEHFFTSVGRLENVSVKHVIFTCITENLIPSLSPSPPDVETLRVYLLLPMFHEFENPRNYANLHVPFAKACSSLKVEAVKIVNMWWGAESTDYFERLIRIYKHVVMYTLRFFEQKNSNSTLRIDRVIVIALDFLANLNRLNSHLAHKVPYDTFYLPELPEVVDIQLDYVKWLAQRDPSVLPGIVPPPGTIYFCNYPFVFDAQAKTVLLETDQSLKMQNAMTQAAIAGSIQQHLFLDPGALGVTQFLVLNVSRENIVQDTIRELGSCDCNDYKKPLKIKFCGEEAEDAGGVKKEFFMLLLKEILDPNYGMFRYYEETRTVWFIEMSFEDEIMYFLIGVLCGLAIYNFTIINLPFPLALYKKLLNEPVTLQDVAGLSPTIAKSLQDVLDYSGSDLEEVFQLTFEMSCEVFGEVMTFPLKANGSSIPVTHYNKTEFVDLYVDMLLNKSVEKHFQVRKRSETLK